MPKKQNTKHHDKHNNFQFSTISNTSSKPLSESKNHPSISDNRQEHHKITKQKLGKALRDNLLRRKISEHKSSNTN